MILIFGDTVLGLPYVVMVGLYYCYYWGDLFVLDEVDA
jgi:hypothetical protein